MCGDENRDVLLVAQNSQVLPEVATGTGIEPRGRLVEKQHAGVMQEAFGELDATLHATRERLDAFLGAIGEADASQDFVDALF